MPSKFLGMLQAIQLQKWDIPGPDVTQLLTTWEKQVQDYEQQSGDKISDAIKLGVVLHHLPDASLRETPAPELTSVRHVCTDGS